MSYCDVIKFLFECRKSSYIALNLLIMNIRIKKIFFLKKSSYIHLWILYIIRPKPGPVAKNAIPRPSGWESNPRPLDTRPVLYH